MFVGVAGKYVRKELVALLVCLSLIGNCVHGTVLCFGADGHVEFESAFHEECGEHTHSRPTDHHHHSHAAEHEHEKHCQVGQCVDVPIVMDKVKASQTIEPLNPTFVTAVADAIPYTEQDNCIEHKPASDALATSSYFTPLRTVILLA